MAYSHRRALLQSLTGAALAALLPLPAQAGYNIFTGEYTVAQAELQARIDTRFPLRLSYAQLFQVDVSHPRLALSAGTARAAITVDLLVRSPLASKALTGVLTISSRLRFDAPTSSIRLVSPQADRIDFAGLAPQDAQQLQAIGQVVAQEALQDLPVHTFKPEELSVGSRVFVPGEITVVDGAIVVKLD
ncbi:DUF1439 domain-containing protein [Xylophilus rhododendri]|uniref:DUF1439 domain-containing protein n=1 Tax=Xylophilus rhododendri TaxID=2697032 RepID=A0A857JCE3_9BURK|nr:DUF1439 domain-containing protein [Xylophilus rhododendri]QHJ00409.1 DUF1439 domain-containing protein [Xylophilus rhododendri]